MSLNDTEKWASMIINEIVREANALEKISKYSSTDDNEAIDRNKHSEISHHAKDSNSSDSVNYKECQPYQVRSYGEILEEYSLTSDTNSNISDEFNKADSDLTSQNGASDYDLKSDVELIEVTDITETANDYVEKAVDNGIESYEIPPSEFITKSSKEEIMLIDLDEVFTQNVEVESTKASESGKVFENLISSENITGSSKDVLEISHEKLDISDSSSSGESDNESEEKMYECSEIVDDELPRNAAENLYLYNDGAVFPRPVGESNFVLDPVQDKNKFKTDKISCISVDSESIYRSSQEYLKRIDDKVELIGFSHAQAGNSRNADRNIKRSCFLADLYYQWFHEDYIKEEMEYRLGSDDRFRGNENLVIHRTKIVPTNICKSISFEENLSERVDDVLIKEEVRGKWESEDKNILDENFVNKQKSINRTCPNIISKPSNEITTETKYHWQDGIDEEKVTGINRGSDAIGTHQIKKCKKTTAGRKIPNKSIFTAKRYKSEQEKDGFAVKVQGMDDEELEIKNERINFVVSTYRDICLTCEMIFIRPFANTFFHFYEFLTFVFFLSICFLYMFYKRVQFLISNCRLLTAEKPHAEKERNMILDSEKKLPSVTAPEAMFADKSTSKVPEKGTEDVSLVKNEIIKFKDLNSFAKIMPEEVVAVSLNYELVTESIRHFYDQGENYLSFICNREQHRATVKANEDYEIHFEMINNIESEENKFLHHETDFDIEVLASSEKLCYKGEVDILKECDNSHNLQEILEEYEDDSELEPVIETNLNRSFIQIVLENSFGDDKSFLNSTEVDGLEIETVPKYRRYSHMKELSVSNIIKAEDYSKLGTSPENMKKHLNSSLNVNLPSFSSRTDSLSDSISLMNISEGFQFDESMELADDIKLSNAIKIEPHSVSLPAGNLLATGASQDAPMQNKRGTIEKEEDENSVDCCFDEELNNPDEISHIEERKSESFEISNTANIHFQNSNGWESSFMCDGEEFLADSSVPTNEVDSSLKDESANEAKHKRKKSLRRRMSFILNNWKNVQVPCMVKNSKKKNKYKKMDGDYGGK